MNIKKNLDDFGSEETYKLYRSVYEIIHPTISKRNISNYKIMLDEKLIPLRVFYPKKISKLEKAIIYIPGKSWIVNGTKNYSDTSKKIVQELDSIVIALDYDLIDNYNKTVEACYQTLKYLIEGLERVGIEKSKITVIADSTGASILANICSDKEPIIQKQVLLYPALNFLGEEKEQYPSLYQNNKLDNTTIKEIETFTKKYITKDYKSPLKANNYHTWPKTLIITGDQDPLRDEGEKLSKLLKQEKKLFKALNIKFSTHGFFNKKEEESIDEAMKEIKTFIARKER